MIWPRVSLGTQLGEAVAAELRLVGVDAAMQFAVEGGMAEGVDVSAGVRAGDYRLTGS